MADNESDKDAGQVAQNSQERAKRDSLFLLAEVIRETGEAMGKARVRNLSATGLMADGDFVFLVGDRLVFDLRGVGAVGGRVVWVEGKRLGFAFDRAIDPQAARKPVTAAPADNIPLYLRYLHRSQQFKN
ncbi:MAG TPA: PilZ domain-containing protein [Sphingobium sp.]|nr:PilZ domain-containing protein [Sphingobium sp.]